MLGAIISLVLFLLVGGFVLNLLNIDISAQTLGVVFSVIVGIMIIRYIL